VGIAIARDPLLGPAPDPRDPRALGVALDRVTPTDITLDTFEAEFRVFYTGLAPINVPVWPHLSDFQPSLESQPFSYLSLSLEVRLSGTGPTQAFGVGWVELYGSAEREDTIMTLKPGEWVRVKAKVTLHTWPTKPMEAQLGGDFWFHDNVFKPEIGGGLTEAVNVYPNHTVFPAVAVHFSPTHDDYRNRRSCQQLRSPRIGLSVKDQNALLFCNSYGCYATGLDSNEKNVHH
jgi:hypothetical protein